MVKNRGAKQREALLYMFEDNEAVIKMIIKGRSPTMRVGSETLQQGRLRSPFEASPPLPFRSRSPFAAPFEAPLSPSKPLRSPFEERSKGQGRPRVGFEGASKGRRPSPPSRWREGGLQGVFRGSSGGSPGGSPGGLRGVSGGGGLRRPKSVGPKGWRPEGWGPGGWGASPI